MSVLVACLAAAVFYEARGEPHLGQVAVAHVVLNRVRSEKFPDDTCRVIRQPGQFPWFSQQKVLRVPKTSRAWQVAEDALAGRSVDPTRGALYFASDVCYLRPKMRIARHTFCR